MGRAAWNSLPFAQHFQAAAEGLYFNQWRTTSGNGCGIFGAIYKCLYLHYKTSASHFCNLVDRLSVYVREGDMLWHKWLSSDCFHQGTHSCLQKFPRLRRTHKTFFQDSVVAQQCLNLQTN